MRASLRAQFGLGPLGILLAAPLVLLGLWLGLLAFRVAFGGELGLYPLAGVELAGAVGLLGCVRRLQDVVGREA